MRIDGDGVVEPEGKERSTKTVSGAFESESKRRGEERGKESSPETEVESADGLEFLSGEIELDVVEVLGDEFWEVGFLKKTKLGEGRGFGGQLKETNETGRATRREGEGGERTNGDDGDSLLG